MSDERPPLPPRVIHGLPGDRILIVAGDREFAVNDVQALGLVEDLCRAVRLNRSVKRG